MLRNPEAAGFLDRYSTRKELKLAHMNRAELQRQESAKKAIAKKKLRTN